MITWETELDNAPSDEDQMDVLRRTRKPDLPVTDRQTDRTVWH